MNNARRVTTVLIGIIIVLMILIFSQLESQHISTGPGSHPQYYCCYSHPSQPREEPPSDHPSARP